MAHISKARLEELYWRKKLNTRQIAKMMGFKRHKSVLDWMKKYGIKRRMGGFQKGHPQFSNFRWMKGDIPWNKGLKNCYPEKTLRKMSRKGKPAWNKGMSGYGKKLWCNPEYREKTIKAIFRGLKRRPTSLERQFIELIKKYNLSFAYCGAGSLLIGYKNPDFYETNGKKICIEVANNVEVQHPQGWAEKRIAHFAKYGWKCLVFRGDLKLNDPDEVIVNKIREAII